MKKRGTQLDVIAVLNPFFRILRVQPFGITRETQVHTDVNNELVLTNSGMVKMNI